MFKSILYKNKEIQYVEVNDEPIHKEIFKNRYVRLYVATIKPGEKTLYHRHSEDTVYVVIKGGVIGSQAVGASKRYPMDFPKSFGFLSKVRLGIRNLFLGSIKIQKGFFFCMMHMHQPIIHRALASDDNLSDIVMIGTEIRNRSDYSDLIQLNPDFYKNDYEAGTFTVFRLRLSSGSSTCHHAYNFPGITIVICGMAYIRTEEPEIKESIDVKLTSGEFLWHDYKKTLNISNAGDETFEAIIIALK